MPFTASLFRPWESQGSTIKCSGRKDFHDLDHATKISICKDCSMRFRGETSCNADFMVISDVGRFRKEVGYIIEWIMKNNPNWLVLEPAYAEAVTAFGHEGLSEPKSLIVEHLARCKKGDRDPEYWKAWNQLVEWYDAKRYEPGTAGSPGEAFTGDLISPKMREGKELRYFYAAVAIIGAAAERLEFEDTRKSCDILVDACRQSVLSGIPLEVI